MAQNQARSDFEEGRLWPEDTIEYRIYTPAARDTVELQHQALECNHFSGQLSRGHVWHYAPFLLRPITGNEFWMCKNSHMHLERDFFGGYYSQLECYFRLAILGPTNHWPTSSGHMIADNNAGWCRCGED